MLADLETTMFWMLLDAFGGDVEGRGDKFGTDDSWISEKDREFIIDHGVLIIQVQSGIHNSTVVADGR